jgi:hypothetical protein
VLTSFKLAMHNNILEQCKVIYENVIIGMHCTYDECFELIKFLICFNCYS